MLKQERDKYKKQRNYFFDQMNIYKQNLDKYKKIYSQMIAIIQPSQSNTNKNINKHINSSENCTNNNTKNIIKMPLNDKILINKNNIMKPKLNSDNKNTNCINNKLLNDNPKTSLYNKSMLNKKIKVYWPLDEKYYYGIVSNINENKSKPILITYNDGDKEWLNLKNEKFEFYDS
eukprot:46529_1